MLPDNTAGSVDSTKATASEAAALQLVGYVSSSQVERCLAESAAEIADSELAYVDLSEAINFDVVGLLRLLATVAGRRDLGRQTRFRLPNDELARHILRLWNFPRAVSVVTLTPFRLLVDQDEWVYFGERWPRPRVESSVVSPQASVLAHLADRQYFGLSSYGVEGGRKLDRMVENETAHWGSYALSKLLAKVLPEPATDIARVIVQEILTNVLERSTPTVAIIGSQLDLVQHADTDAPPGLTVSVWDDGPSLVRALRARLAASNASHVAMTAALDKVVIEPLDRVPDRLRDDSAWRPDSSSTDPEILLASILPSLTHGPSAVPKPTSAAGGPDDAGFGLFALYRTAVDTFRGSVEIRTAQSALAVDRPEAGGHYRLRVNGADTLSPLTGNIVTVRLPVNDG